MLIIVINLCFAKTIVAVNCPAHPPKRLYIQRNSVVVSSAQIEKMKA